MNYKVCLESLDNRAVKNQRGIGVGIYSLKHPCL